MARTPNEVTITDTQEPTRIKRVIIQRPAGNKDIGQPLGFNDVFNVYPFDTPVEMPAEMVDFFRAQKIAQCFPGEDGQPVITYINQFHIVDA